MSDWSVERSSARLDCSRCKTVTWFELTKTGTRPIANCCGKPPACDLSIKDLVRPPDTTPEQEAMQHNSRASVQVISDGWNYLVDLRGRKR